MRLNYVTRKRHMSTVSNMQRTRKLFYLLSGKPQKSWRSVNGSNARENMSGDEVCGPRAMYVELIV